MWTYSAKIWETLAPHRPIDHEIDLEPGFNLPYGRIYHLSEVELKTLKAYIETNLANGSTQRSLSPAAAPILFAKKDGGLQLTSWSPITSYESRKATSTKPRFAPGTCSSSPESCRSGWRTYQLPYYQAKTPIGGDRSSAEQRRLKRGMTLPEVPE